MPKRVEMIEVITTKQNTLGVLGVEENRSVASVASSVIPPISISIVPMSNSGRVRFKIFFSWIRQVYMIFSAGERENFHSAKLSGFADDNFRVELTRVELVTSCMPCKRSPN